MITPLIANEDQVAVSNLNYKYYTPPPADDLPPLVIMVHGRGGDESVMWLFKKTLKSLGAVLVSLVRLWSMKLWVAIAGGLWDIQQMLRALHL